MNSIIEVNHIFKKYKTQGKYALNDISFSVEEGEIVGVLGPNGAGKSTLVKVLLGVIHRSAGEVRVLGKEPLRFGKKEKAQIGVLLGGKSNLIFHLPVMDSVLLFQSIYKVPKENFQKNLEYYTKILHCEEFLNQRVSTLSLGQKLRAELLCILIYEPKLLVLDEPTLGLDIEGKRQFREVLRNLVQNKNISVIITTHDINDMEKLCSRFLMICHGEKVLDLSNYEFEERLSKYRILISDCQISDEMEGVRFIENNGHTYRYLVEKNRVDTLKEYINQSDYKILQFDEPRLEDLFYEYYR